MTESESIAFAQSYDPQWFHTHKQAAETGPFQGLIISGFHTCSIAMKMIVDYVLTGSESYASPGLSYVKWPNPVRPDDVLSLTATVLEKRCSSSQPTLGILKWRWQMWNQDNKEVLDLEATSLFDLSNLQP